MHLVHRQTCRVCGSRALSRVIDLGEQHLQGSFVKVGKEEPPMRKVPLVLVRCDPSRDEGACGLLQLGHTTPTEVLYSAYWYRSGTNDTMRSHLRGVAEEAAAVVGVEHARALDIGCNDGTLLKCYPPGFAKYGIDPSDVAREIGDDVEVVQDLFPSEELTKRSGRAAFDIITSIAMFYDLERPLGFVRAIRDHLAPEGLWIFEQSYMPTMLEMNSYDTICHEHLEYYSLAVIEDILKRCDLKIVRVALNAINGGSIRCYATHRGCFKYKSVTDLASLSDLRRAEFDRELDTDRPYKDFQDRIEVHRRDLRNLLKNLKQQGKRIHIYGASTKGNTILQWCGIDTALVDCAADRNPDKFGARTLGTDIPIMSEAESRALEPDYYLVLPWHFRDEFVKREAPMLARGTALIFPLPKLEIVTG